MRWIHNTLRRLFRKCKNEDENPFKKLSPGGAKSSSFSSSSIDKTGSSWVEERSGLKWQSSNLRTWVELTRLRKSQTKMLTTKLIFSSVSFRPKPSLYNLFFVSSRKFQFSFTWPCHWQEGVPGSLVNLAFRQQGLYLQEYAFSVI